MTVDDSATLPTWSRRIESERRARGWSVARASAYLRGRDARLPVAATLAKYWAQRWESGRNKPGDLYRRHLCALLGMPLEIFDDSDKDALAVQCLDSRNLATITPDNGYARPRVEELVIMAAHESADHARRHAGSNVHQVTLDQLDAELRLLLRDFVDGFPLPAFLRARALRDEIFQLSDGQQWPGESRRLYSLAGWSCALLAVASADFFGRYDAAAAQCRAAWLCAEMSDDTDLKAWVRSLQSGIAFWAGKWSQAASFAADSVRLSRTAPAAMRAAVMEARARARLADNRAVREGVAKSVEFRELPRGEYDLGVADFTEANRIRCAGTALLWTQDYGAAQTHLGEALAAYERNEPTAYAHIAVTRLDLAAAHASTGDIERLSEALEPILIIDPARRLAGVTRRMGELRARLATQQLERSPKIREIAARIESFQSTFSSLSPDES